MLLYQNTASQSIQGNWKDEEQIAKAAERAAGDAAEQAIVTLISGVS